MRKTRKKGSVMVEFLVVLPLLMLLTYVIFQGMLYYQALQTAKEAATEISRELAMEMRGEITGFSSDTAIQDKLKQEVLIKSYEITRFNELILLNRDIDGNECVVGSEPVCPNITLETTVNPSDSCDNAIYEEGVVDEKGRVICAYVKSTGGDREHYQIIVRLRAKFKLEGGFIPGVETITIDATGSAQRELKDRFYYKEVPTKDYGSNNSTPFPD